MLSSSQDDTSRLHFCNGDVVAYADVELFPSYINAALDYGVLQECDTDRGFFTDSR